MDTPHLASPAFADAYRAFQEKRGSLPIGIGHTHEQLTRAGVPEAYAVQALQKDIVPATIIRLWDNGISLDFVAAFLHGRAGWTTADAALTEIILVHTILRDQNVPEDYAQPLLRVGGGPLQIARYWTEGVALEYAQQLIPEELSRWAR